MGKTKNARFQRAQFSPDGLPVKAVKRPAEDEIDDDDVVESPHADLLEKVRMSIFSLPELRQAQPPGFWLASTSSCLNNDWLVV